jgi:hypothetical protein
MIDNIRLKNSLVKTTNPQTPIAKGSPKEKLAPQNK